MLNIYKKIIPVLCLTLMSISLMAQQDRFVQIEEQLKELSKANPGLNEKVDFSVSGASIQEFLRGLAESNSLNISVDPQLSFKIYNNFTNEKVSNIILFLCKEYDLDIRFVGSIMSFYKYQAPQVEKPAFQPKEILVKHNGYTNTLSLDLKDDTLSKVAKKITQVSKKNVILSSGVANTIISVYIEEMPFDNALEKMAFANKLKVVKTDDDFYVIKPLEEGDDIIAQNNAKGGKKKTFNKNYAAQANNNSGGNLFVEVVDSLSKKFISLEALNAPIADVIKAVAEETGISYFQFSEIKGNTSTRVFNVLFDEFLTYLLQGTDYTFKRDQSLYLIGERKLEGLRANKVIQFQHRSLESIVEVIPAELKKGVEIKDFKELNSILLTGSLPQIMEIEAFVKQLDRVVPLVMIEAIIMDVSKGKTVKTGIKAGLSDTVSTGGTLFPGFNFTFGAGAINSFLASLGTNNAVNLGRVSPKFYVNLSALEENNNVEIRQVPKLSTLNGHDANMSIGKTVYYSLETQNTVGSLAPSTIRTVQYQSVQANLSINIKPHVAGDDQVTLDIDVNISDFLPGQTTSGPPNSSTSQFKSLIRVRNEEMIVLGGIERITKSDQGEGVPVLSRIPVLKWIFSSRTRSKNKTITVIFIKPTIIY